MKTNRFHFNLIEIVLAVAVVAFGVVVILGMLPKGLRAVRNAGTESFSSEVIDQMAGYLQMEGVESIAAEVQNDSEEKNFVKAYATNSNARALDEEIMQKYTSLIPYLDLSTNFQANNNLTDRFVRTNTTGVFYVKPKTSNDWEKSLYVIVMGETHWQEAVDDADAELETRADFSGLLRVWKRPRQFEEVRVMHDGVAVSNLNKELPSSHDCVESECASKGYCVLLKDVMRKNGNIKGAMVCMELSYPLSLPYAERTKRFYTFDVGE